MSDPAARFADWARAELGLSGARISRELSGGNSNLTRLVEHDGGRLVMRSAPAATVSPRAHLGVEREAAFMAALAGHAPVPEVVCWCDDTDVIGQPFALVAHVDGVSITDALPTAYDNVDALNSLGGQLATAASRGHPGGISAWRTAGDPKTFSPDRLNAGCRCGETSPRASCRSWSGWAAGCWITCPRTDPWGSCTATITWTIRSVIATGRNYWR